MLVRLATALLYVGPLLAGLAGQGWAMVPLFLAVFLLSSIGEQPGLEGQTYLRQLASGHGLAEDALAEPGAALLRQFLQAGVIGPLTAPP